MAIDREEGGVECGPQLDMQPRRERPSAKLRGLTGTHLRRACRVVVVLGLVSLFGVGYSPQPDQEAFRSAIRPLTHSEAPSLPTAADAAASTAGSSEEALGKEAKEEKLLAPQPPSAVPAKTCNDLRVLVDERHSLPADYVPEGLVSLRDHGIPALGSDALRLRREAAEDLRSLVEAAAKDGEELVVASAYRSYDDQRLSHERLASVYGAQADAMSAKPGHSQHQLGTAVDFTNAAAAYEVWEPFGQTSASAWLVRHAPEHGFVLAYPRGKERETGYRWEPWHYRYIGKENAKRLDRSNLNLQAFLEREGVTPRC